MILTESIGTVFDGWQDKKVKPCWWFCQRVLLSRDILLPDDPAELMKCDGGLYSIVLFECADEWHAGVVWPDGLHFVHACAEREDLYVIRRDRLTKWPWNLLLKGFYRVNN